MSDSYGKATASRSNLKKEEKYIMPAEDKKVDKKNDNSSKNNKNDANNNNNNKIDEDDDEEEDDEDRLEKVLHTFRETVSTEEGLNNAAEHLLNELVDDAVFGVFLEMHQLAKTGNLVAIDGVPENPEFPPNTDNKLNTGSSCSGIGTAAAAAAAGAAAAAVTSTGNAMASGSSSSNSAGGGGTASSTSAPSTSGVQTNRSSHASTSSESKSGAAKVLPKYALKVDKPNQDIFGVKIAKKAMDCNCPNCDRVVAAARFAPHLEKCMGMGRLSSRIASRRLANNSSHGGSLSAPSMEPLCAPNSVGMSKNYAHATSSSITTDEDEDDVDWSSAAEKRRKKTHGNSRNNGSRRNYSNPKFL